MREEFATGQMAVPVSLERAPWAWDPSFRRAAPEGCCRSPGAEMPWRWLSRAAAPMDREADEENAGLTPHRTEVECTQ